MSDDPGQQLDTLLEFFRKQVADRPETFTHAPGLISDPGFFSVAALQKHLANPLLGPDWVFLKIHGQEIALANDYMTKNVWTRNLSFLDKQNLNEALRQGAALVLEGIDILEPSINSFATGIDAALPCALVNCVAFFSQAGTEAYEGHVDQDDVLVIHISGGKLWHIFAPQQRRYAGTEKLSREQLGPKIKELRMRPGDALYLRAGVPHMCTTTGDHSLHLAFDLIDATPNPKTITEEANRRYEHAAADCYVPAEQVMDKYIELLRSPDFHHALQGATRNIREQAAQFRRSIARASQVDALSQYIVETATDPKSG